MSNNKTLFFICSAALFLVFSLFSVFLLKSGLVNDDFPVKPKFVTIYIGNSVVKAEVVYSLIDKTRGLGGRGNINDGEGMLFVFSYDDYQGIWMKNMKFPIDIFWLSKDFRIVDFKESVKPETYPEIFYPREKARFVLETGGGFAEKEKIKFGDSAKILK